MAYKQQKPGEAAVVVVAVDFKSVTHSIEVMVNGDCDTALLAIVHCVALVVDLLQVAVSDAMWINEYVRYCTPFT